MSPNGSTVSRCAVEDGYSANGTLCAVCKPGFARDGRGGRGSGCTACNDSANLWLGIAFGVSIFCAFVCRKMWKLVLQEDEADAGALFRKMERSGVQRITINHISTLSSIGELAVKGPAMLRAMFSFLNSAVIGISASSTTARCALQLSVYQETVVELLSLLLYPVLICTCMFLLSLRMQEVRRINSTEFLVGVAVLVCYLKYTAALQSLLSLFSCVRLRDGSSFLIKDMTVQCGGSTYTTYTIVAAVIAFVLAFGV